MHVIEYTTEGKVVLRDETTSADPVAVQWMKGSETIYLRSGNNSMTMSKAQLLELVSIGEQIGRDLQPDMGHLQTILKPLDPSLPIIDPELPRIKIHVGVDVPSNWENRLDMQYVVENEIRADRWSWNFVPEITKQALELLDKRPPAPGRPIEEDFSDK